MMKKVISTAFLALVLAVTPVMAGSSGGGSRSSSSSSSSSSRSYSAPSSSYSKPSTPSSSYSKPSISSSTSSTTYSKPSVPSSAPSVTYSKPTESQSGYSKPSTSTTSSVVAPKPTTMIGNAAVKGTSASSLQSYQAERALNKNPPKPISYTAARQDPVYSSVRTTYRTPDAYIAHRSTVINNYHTSYPNAYGWSYGMAPNYGHWDSGFLMGVLIGQMGNHHDNAAWMYSQMNQPWYPAWRADVEKQAKDNAELKAKLEAMDQQVKELKDKNAKPVTQLPAGIDPAAAITPEAVLTDDDEDEESGLPWMWIIGGSIFVLIGGGMVHLYRVGGRR